jgi:RecB family exonuclease
MISVETAPVLSPTQVRCFMDCHARWWFKYNLRYPDPPNGNLALGRAVHRALTQNFAQKVETCEDLPPSGLFALFREAWALERNQAEFRDDEDPSQLAFAGEALVAKYLDEIAPAVELAAVELHVEGEIGGVRVQGFIDLLDVDGRIIDIKTAKAFPSSIEPMHRFQVATYRELAPAASGKGRLDRLVKTKTPKIVLQDFDVTEEDLRATRSTPGPVRPCGRSTTCPIECRCIALAATVLIGGSANANGAESCTSGTC